MTLPQAEPIHEVPEAELPDVENLVTEDDEPVDGMASEKQQRLLTGVLYDSPVLDPPFVAAANVGVFAAVRRPPLVPDMFLSLDAEIPRDWWNKAHRSYFLWEYGKPPDVAVEIVSNREGGELDRKMREYGRMRVPYYVVYDPRRLLSDGELRVFVLREGGYAEKEDPWLDEVGLGLVFWEGTFEGRLDRWLRWCDRQGRVLPTGRERADEQARMTEAERRRAEEERRRADEQARMTEAERERAERLAARLRAAGIDPDEP